MRYFFNIRNGDIYVPDDEGMEFLLFEGAHTEVLETSKDLLLQGAAADTVVEVTDLKGRLLETFMVGCVRN